jgi:hypothetical protein
MRKLLILFLCLITSPVWAFSPAIQAVVGGSGAGGSSGKSFTDDFNRGDNDTVGANWTEAYQDWDISSNTVIFFTEDSVGVLVYSGQATDTINQYVKVKFADFQISGWDYPGVVVRYVNSTSPFYGIIHSASENTITWQSFPVVEGNGTVIGSSSLTFATGDSLGVTIEGTGDDTIVRIWKNPTGAAPTTISSWGGSGPDVTLSDNPGTAADTGKYVGIRGYKDAATTLSFDDFSGGDLPY